MKSCELAGCDLLTIGPSPLDELQGMNVEVVQNDPDSASREDIERMSLDEKSFRWALNEDPMATEKTAEGIRKFAADLEKKRNSCGEAC